MTLETAVSEALSALLAVETSGDTLTTATACLAADRALAAARLAVAALRDEAILAEADGRTLADLGSALGVTRQRAHQLVQRARSRPGEWDGPSAAREDPRASFAAVCESAYLAAEVRCRGFLVNPAGKAAGIRPEAFFAAHGRRAPARYASEELQAHWMETSSPPTWAEWTRRERIAS